MSTSENILLFIYFYLFILATSPVGSLFLDQRLNKFPLLWESRTLTTGAPGKSQEKLSCHPKVHATIQHQLTMDKMKVSTVVSVTYQLWCGWLAAQISDMMESPVGASGDGRFYILSLVLRAFIDLSNHILVFPTTNSQSKNNTW